MSRRVNMIVIPAVGRRTRLLAAMRVTVKEMRPVHDTPTLARAYTGGHMVAAMDVPAEKAFRHGIFKDLSAERSQRLAASGMVETPISGTETSQLAAVGQQVPDPSGIDMDAITSDAGRLSLTAFRFSGRSFECGCVDGLLEAAIARQPQVGAREKGAKVNLARNGGLRRDEAQQAQD
jgi:UTP-glucose-1-phosphate uridylyltransferase